MSPFITVKLPKQTKCKNPSEKETADKQCKPEDKKDTDTTTTEGETKDKTKASENEPTTTTTTTESGSSDYTGKEGGPTSGDGDRLEEIIAQVYTEFRQEGPAEGRPWK